MAQQMCLFFGDLNYSGAKPELLRRKSELLRRNGVLNIRINMPKFNILKSL